MDAFLRLLVAGGALLLTAKLAAAEPSVALEPPDPTTCVDASELVQALARAKIHAEPAARQPPPTPTTETPGTLADERGEHRAVVSIHGTPSALRIRIDRNGARRTEELPAATCDAATDAVAAFLVSALGPPPPLSTRIGLEELQRAIGDELARRDVQLAVEAVRLTLARDTWGNVHAYLEPQRAAGCSADVQLGVVDQATHDTIPPAANVLVEALAAARTCVKTKPQRPAPPVDLPPKTPPNEVDPVRVHALHAALDRVPRVSARWFGATLELTNAITFALLEPPPEARHDPTARTFRAWGGAMLFGGAVGTLTVTPNRALDFNQATVFAGYGFYAAGSLFDGDTFARGATAGGFFMSAGLAAANFVRPRPLTRLNADYSEVSRAGLTPQRAAAMERDLEHADPLVPNWLVVTPIIAGNTLAAAHLIASNQADASLLVVNVVFAAGFGVAAIIDAAMGSVWGSYERALHAAGLKQLSLAPGPTPLGASLVGRF